MNYKTTPFCDKISPMLSRVKPVDSRITIAVSLSHKLINHGPVILVSSYHEGKSNIITLAWQMPLSVSPKLMGICVGKTRFSHELIIKSREFVINVPTADLKDLVLGCGSKSGRDVDKFSEFGLTTIPGTIVKAPLIGECAAHIECAVVDNFEAGDHTIFVGEVKSASSVKGFLKDNNVVDLNKFPTLHHLGGNHFAVLGR